MPIIGQIRNRIVSFVAGSDEDFERFLMNVLSLSPKDNTYKFAFARFLLEYCKDHEQPHVEFSTIAQYFLKYYWHMECKSKLKQAPQAEKMPEIIKIIRKQFGTRYYPQTFEKIKQEEPDKIQKCIEQIVKKCFHNVTWRFQKVKSGQTSKENKLFFDYKIERTIHSNKKLINFDHGINLNPQAMLFFKKYNVTLNKSVTLEWARFLEKLNRGLPELISKTERELVQRTSLTKYRKALEPFFKNCFYCQNPLKTGKETNVDHVIPFHYIAEDKMWNFTLACQKCNCKKLGSLPPEKYLKNLIDRNNNYGVKIPLLEKSLTLLGEGFEKIIRDHYKNANSQGYDILRTEEFP